MIKEYPLEGVRTYSLNILPDERGFFAEALRQDWQDFIDEWTTWVNLSYSYPNMVRIPGHYLHVTKTVSSEPSLTVYFTTRLYDYKNPDEERRPWDDSKIIPPEINGNRNDLRVNKPWDWFYPPHK